VAYSRKVFHTIGLFDQAFDACEDVEFNHRVDAASLTCYFTPTVKVAYHPRGTLRGLFYQLARYGMGRARLAAKHPHSITMPALVPPLWVLWVIVGGLLSLFMPYLAWLWAASVALYVSVLIGAAVVLSRGQPRGIGRRIPLVFLGIHCGFAWGFLREVVRGAAMRWVRYDRFSATRNTSIVPSDVPRAR
jgi:succinoglycan biosynthesis protein ExoA